tara:strand:+ start:461 stop:670 length:210 start_codon:yes stop_codon:yes gene_type:complete
MNLSSCLQLQPPPSYLFLIMSNNKYDYEAELKAAKRAEIERIWFAQEATNKELLQAYKALDIKENKEPN